MNKTREANMDAFKVKSRNLYSLIRGFPVPPVK